MSTSVPLMVHVTQVKRALKALLLAELPMKLQIADLAANDGIRTPVPFEIYTCDKQALDGFPAIELVATNSSPRVDSFAQVYEHRIAIGFTLAGDDEDTITTHVERYMWAIRHVCRDTLMRGPETPTGPIDTGAEQYTPLDRTAGRVEEPFVKGGFIEALIQTVE